MHLNLQHFPLWGPHTTDILVADSGEIKILDWSGGFSPDAGNCCLLPKAFHCSPAEREEVVVKLGNRAASQMVNCNVMAFYLGAAQPLKLMCNCDGADFPCQAHPASSLTAMMWKMAVRSLMCQEMTIEELVTQRNPVQLGLRMPG